jgi:hypothetical protein
MRTKLKVASPTTAANPTIQTTLVDPEIVDPTTTAAAPGATTTAEPPGVITTEEPPPKRTKPQTRYEMLTSQLASELEAAKEAWEAVKESFLTTIDRVLHSGQRLSKVKKTCDLLIALLKELKRKSEAKGLWQKTCAKINIAPATAARHIHAFDCEQKIQEWKRQGKTTFQYDSIEALIDLVDPPKKRDAVFTNAEEGEVDDDAEEGEEKPAKPRKSNGTALAIEEAIRGTIGAFFPDREVLIKQPKKNQKIEVEVTMDIIVIIPVD